jgi:hypothetical protein
VFVNGEISHTIFHGGSASAELDGQDSTVTTQYIGGGSIPSNLYGTTLYLDFSAKYVGVPDSNGCYIISETAFANIGHQLFLTAFDWQHFNTTWIVPNRDDRSLEFSLMCTTGTLYIDDIYFGTDAPIPSVCP